MANDDTRIEQEEHEPVGRAEVDRTSEDLTTETQPHHDERRGDFAEGQTSTHVSRDALPGDFAEGQEEHERGGASAHRGDFAEGQTGTHVAPDARRGGFAEGEGEHVHSDERR